jgi:hypothetical protein
MIHSGAFLICEERAKSAQEVTGDDNSRLDADIVNKSLSSIHWHTNRANCNSPLDRRARKHLPLRGYAELVNH